MFKLTTILFIGSLVACHSTDKRDLRSNAVLANQEVPQNSAEGLPIPSTQSPQVEQCDSEFETPFDLFDRCYDYNPEDHISIADMQERFPIMSSDVSFLEGGSEFFAARMHLLELAEKTVRIQSLTFTNDESAALIANKLIELRKKGVQVQIIVDSVHNLTIPEQELYYKLQSNGVQVEGFQYMYLGLFQKVIDLDNFGMTFGQLNMRDHEKLFIIDGDDPNKAQAIIGGANIANRYFRVETENPEFMWRDRDALAKGDVVLVMSKGFDENFSKKKEARVGSLFQSSSFWWELIGEFVKDDKPFDLDERNQIILHRLQSAVENYQPSLLEWEDATVRFLKSRPREREDLIHPAYLTMMKDSQKSIRILNSYFLPDDAFINGLIAAAQRGVKVEIMTNHAKNTDFSQLTLLTRSYYSDLLSINEGLPEPMIFIREWAGDETLNNGEGQNHSKVAIFDDQVVFVGSYNLDPRSHKLNSESLIAIYNESAAKPYVEEFNLFSGDEFSVNISLEEAREYESDRSLKETLELKILEVIKPFL